MSKSGFLAKVQAQKAADIKFHRYFTMQWCADAAILAAHEVFQRKGKKLVEFYNAFVRHSHEIANMTLDDAKADKTLEYTKVKLDEQLQAILGEDFQTWDERYSFVNLGGGKK